MQFLFLFFDQYNKKIDHFDGKVDHGKSGGHLLQSQHGR